MSSNARFRLVTTAGLALTLAVLACGLPAVAIYNVVTAAIVIAYQVSHCRDRLWRGVLAIELVVAATAALGPLAYLGFAANAAAMAFITWFAWWFRMTRLF